MKIQLTNQCHQTEASMAPTNGGRFCAVCAKAVIDYSYMTDAQMLASIKKHGLGCGKFRKDQLDRELTPANKRKWNKLFYLPLIAAIFSKPLPVKAQSVPDTMQVPYKRPNNRELEKINPAPIKADTKSYTSNSDTRMGTGNIATTYRYRYIGFYYGNIRITLFKFLEKCKTSQ